MRKIILLLASMVLAMLVAGGVTLVGAEKPAQAAFPGENGKIAFTSNRDVPSEIYTMNPDGSDQTRLTYNNASVGEFSNEPAFSSDGTQIAFTRNHQDNVNGRTNRDIYVMNSDGSNQTRLTYDPAVDMNPTFSPDGTKIAFTSLRDGTSASEIYIMNSDGSNQTRLTNNTAYDTTPAFSPDGTKIAFTSSRDGSNEIYVMNPDGSNQTRITYNQLANDTTPAFSPDGTKIVFQSVRNGNLDIYIMNPDGSDQIRLTDNPAGDTEPAFSPDGTKIAFTSNPSGDTEIYTMSSDGSNQTRLTYNPALDSMPNWQPLPSAYGFSGFFSPINNVPTLNEVKAGRSVPVKFSLDGHQGLEIFAEGYPKSQQIDCDSVAQVDSVEQTATAGESSLSYDATTDQYIYVWKTNKAWAGTCRQFTMKLDDGSTHLANFKFRS